MISITTYLENELSRYFPDGNVVVVFEPETGIYTAYITSAVRNTRLDCEVGSDDDCFVFYRDGTVCYTVPPVRESEA